MVWADCLSVIIWNLAQWILALFSFSLDPYPLISKGLKAFHKMGTIKRFVIKIDQFIDQWEQSTKQHFQQKILLLGLSPTSCHYFGIWSVVFRQYFLEAWFLFRASQVHQDRHSRLSNISNQKLSPLGDTLVSNIVLQHYSWLFTFWQLAEQWILDDTSWAVPGLRAVAN